VTPQVEQFIITFGYIGVLIGLYVEHVFPPAPMQVVIPIAGFLVGRGELNFWGVWVAGTIGGVLGSYTLYAIGHWVDEPRVRRFIKKRGHWLTIAENDLDRSLHFLDRYGTAMVFGGAGNRLGTRGGDGYVAADVLHLLHSGNHPVDWRTALSGSIGGRKLG
jgi:membrane protein DedA with SNARE-associated domain